MKQVFLCCCIAACVTTIGIFARNSSQQISPVISSSFTDTIPHGKDTMNKNLQNKNYPKDTGYNKNRNMNVDTGRSNINDSSRSMTDTGRSNMNDMNRNNNNNSKNQDSSSDRPPR